MPSKKAPEPTEAPKRRGRPPKAKDEPKVEVKQEYNGRVIKYMGTADVRLLPVGETLLMSVPPLRREVKWNSKEGHLIHTAEYPEVPESFWDRLLNFSDFRNVTEEFHDPKKDLPKGAWEALWRLGMR